VSPPPHVAALPRPTLTHLIFRAIRRNTEMGKDKRGKRSGTYGRQQVRTRIDQPKRIAEQQLAMVASRKTSKPAPFKNRRMRHPENQQRRFRRCESVGHPPEKQSQRRPPKGGRYKCNAKPNTTSDRRAPMSFAFDSVAAAFRRAGLRENLNLGPDSR
jgi:hypothetical protein